MGSDLVVSVLIATRNRAESLKDTLASLSRQTRQPDEVIVVDNGSSDHTKEIATGFRDTLNVTYVYEAVKGIPNARNSGIREARGDIIAFIDDDCVAEEDWLKNIEIPFIRDPNIGVVGGEITYHRIGESSLEAFYIENMTSGKRGDKEK